VSSESYRVVQEAIYNPLTILEEIISIQENEEESTLKREVDKRRMRLGAARPEQLRREVGLEIWTVSRVRIPVKSTFL
jgi:superkiller protein 3